MELGDIQSDMYERAERSDEMENELEAHRERVQRLEEAVAALNQSAEGVQSDDLQRSLEAAEQAKQETEHKLDALREEKEQLLQENDEQQQDVEKAHTERSNVMQQIGYIENLSAGSDEALGQQVSTMRLAVEQDLTQLSMTSEGLREVRAKLERIAV